MKPMTHGELRGSLLLLGLLAVITITVYIFRSCGDNTSSESPLNTLDTPGSHIEPASDSPSAADSAAILRLRFDAGKFDRRDSIRASRNRSSTATDSTDNMKRSARKSTKAKTINNPKRHHSPSPSPIDRPV